jgi:2-polyprenyl-3-methyl-5-hydroxy-6-metoxy-1,4-benzoquinol methylase
MNHMRHLKRLYRLAKRWASAILPYRPTDGRNLNAEYARGDWSYLRNDSELARFYVISGYIQHYSPNARVLEIGCGEGILQERLCTGTFSRYLGVDISTEAIAKANAKANDRISFLAADANTFTPGEQFDVVVFNECLEYFRDPLAAVRRYESALTKNGVMIVSMFAGVETMRTNKIWKVLRTRYRFRQETQVGTTSGYVWNIKVTTPVR